MPKLLKAPFLLCFISFTLLFGIKNANAQTTYVWNGGAAGSWNVPTNWTIGGFTSLINYPGSLVANDIAVINTSNANITYSGTHTIGSLQSTNFGVSNITITFSGATPTLTITGGLSIAQPASSATGLTFSGTGTASVSGTSTFSFQSAFAIGANATVTFNSGSTITYTNGNGALTNAGILNCNGCTLNSSSSITNTGTINTTASALFSFSGTPSFINNTNIINLTSSTFTFGNNANYLQNSGAGVVTAKTSTINLSGAGAYLNNSATFKATTTTFNFGNANYIQNSGAFTTQSSCIFNLSTSSSYITNSSIFRDHTSTFTFTGQGTNIQNTGAGANMHISGSTIDFNASGANNAMILNNTATFIADSVSVINVSTFTSRITNTGTFSAGTSGSACVITLGAQSAYITNTSIFNLGSTSIIYPTGLSTSVTNTNPGVFTLQSDANGSAAIGPLNTSVGSAQQALMTGTFNVERYFQGSAVFDAVKNRWKGRNYRIISSPVNTGNQITGTAGKYYIYGLNYIVGATAGQTTLASSTTNAFVTGAVGGSTSAGNPSLYLYRENKAPSNATFTSGNFIGLTNITSAAALGTSDPGSWTIPAGNGLFFFFRGNATSFATRTSAPYIAPENVTLTSTGTLNQQSVAVYNWYTPNSGTLGYTSATANAAVRGFNMIGNPYACSIDWNTYFSGGITQANVNPTIWVFNPVTNQYDTYITTSVGTGTATGSASKTIASGQGFFVQGNVSGPPSLTFNETAKAAVNQVTGGNLLMSTSTGQNIAQQTLRLKLSIDSLNYDDIVIGFNATASAKYNGMEDAQYIQGIHALEGLSSFSSDSVKLSVNNLPLPKQTQQVIRLNVDAALTGQYTLERTALDAIPQIYEVWLLDKYKKDSLDIRANPTYVFDINLADTASYGSNRFEIVIRQNAALALRLIDFTATKTAAGAQIVWKTENEQNYTNFTIERSTDDGVTFDVLGGFTSSAQGTYSSLDKVPPATSDQYRLKLEDLNGSITYSKVITLNYGDQSNSTVNTNISIYPNPSSGVINLAINKSNPALNGSVLQSTGPIGTNQNSITTYGIKIVNINGNVIKTETSAQPAAWQGDVSTLLPGTYIIQVVNNSDKSVVGKGTFVKL